MKLPAMRSFLVIVFAVGAAAQTPDLTGVWKADLAASQFPGGRGPTQYLELISATGPKVTEQSAAQFPFGSSRSELVFRTDGAPVIEPYDGVPSRETGAMKDGKFAVTIETDGKPDTTTRTYELSAEGQKLTISIQATRDGKEMQSRLVLDKQPDSASAPLREAPPVASTVFKNLKTPMKDLNSEQFIDNMHYFSWALNKNCEFCHVQRDFPSDDKKEKRIARAMIEMTNGVNQNTFKGKQKVACFTCHEFREHPQMRPLFAGEKPEEHEEHHEEHKGGE
jgi:Photosynthetic reaction centre cytochrome C subunit